MFTLRDTLAATLLGVQLPSNDSSNNSLNDVKKPKKKAHKKKPKKKKTGTQAREEEDDNDYESISSDAANADDDEDVIAGFGATLQSATAASAMASKKAAIMAQQYESTQIEDQIHQMIRKLAEEFNLDKSVVSETVNRMFEGGLQYDNREAVLKYLPIKGNATRSIDVKDESGLQFTSAASSPYPVSTLPQNTANARPTTRTARTFSGSAPDAGSVVGTSSAVDAEAAAALAKLTTPSAAKPAAVVHTSADHASAARAKHGKEIGAVAAATQQAPIGPKPSVLVTHSEPALNSMKEKLDYVASYSKTNLYDSLAALCSWASVSVAPDSTISAEQEKQQKMDAFFQSQALEILLTTLFSDEAQQLSTRPDVKGAFHALLQHVLLSHGDSGGAGNMQHITDTLAQVVSQVCSLRTAQVVPAFSAHSVRGNQILAQQIAACVKRLYSQLTFPVSTAASEAHNAVSGAHAEAADGNDDLFGKLEVIDAQLHALEKSAVKKGTNATEAAQEKVQNMFLSREIHCDKLQLCLESVKKTSTQKPASTATRSTTSKAQIPTANAAELTRSIAESSASIERILLNECDLLGSGQAHPHSPVASATSVQSKHQQSHHINSQFDRLSYERDAKLGALSNELSASNMRMQELGAHKQRLLEQVQLCDQELGNLGARANALNSELSNATFYYQQQLDQLVQTGNSVRKSLQAHDQVNSLVTAVRNFENKFAEALLHEHTAHVAAANAGSHMPVGALSPGGRTTTILTSSSYGANKSTTGGSTSVGAVDGSDEQKVQQAQQAERVLLLSNTLKSYVAAEAQCIQFLTERIVPAEAKLVTLRKELMAYAALSMKGTVVQQAEASVKQLENEVVEDQQAVRQLQQNVADTLAQVKALQDSLAPAGSGRAGKYVAPGTKVAPAASLPAAAAVKVDMPSAELALIVQYCNSVQVTAAAVILAHAGKITAPAPPAPAPVIAAAPAAAHPVIAATAAVTTAAPAVKTSGDRTAPAADTSAARKPRESTRDAKATGTGRTERDRGDKAADSRRTGGGRGKVEAKAEVDTSSAIQLLEKSCLQKPSTGGAPTKVAPIRVERAVPKAEPSAPVCSVWKVPSSGANGMLESKSGETVKSLKEIQEEQQNEKLRLAQQKAQKKKDEAAAAAAFLAAPNAVVADTTAAASAVEETPTAPVLVIEETPAIACATESEASVVVVMDADSAVVIQVSETAVETRAETIAANETIAPTPSKAPKVSKTPKKEKEVKGEPTTVTGEKEKKANKVAPATAPATENDVAETPAVEPAEGAAVQSAECEASESPPMVSTKSAVKMTPSKAKPAVVEEKGDEHATAEIGEATVASVDEIAVAESPVKAHKVKSAVKKTPSKATPVVAEDEAVAVAETTSQSDSPVKAPKVKSVVKKASTKVAPDTAAEAIESTSEQVGDASAEDAAASSETPVKVAKTKSGTKKAPSKAAPVVLAEGGDGSAADATELASAEETMTTESPVKVPKVKSAVKKTPSKAAPVVAGEEAVDVTEATVEEALTGDSPVKVPKVKSAVKKTPTRASLVVVEAAAETVAEDGLSSDSPVKASKVKSAVKKTASKTDSVTASDSEPSAPTEESSETPVKVTKAAKVKSATKKTPSKATLIVVMHESGDDDNADGALPMESADSTEGEAVLSVEIDDSHVRACTPTGSGTHAEAGSRSPLVEFHSTYTFPEEGIHHAVSRSHDINPMQQLSPLVEHHSIYPEMSDECDLLHEIEENITSDQQRAGDGDGNGTPLGAALSASTVSTANTAASKIRDINPMALASPGRGIVRIKLDMSQASEGDESALSPSMVLAKSNSDDQDQVQLAAE